MKKVIVMLLVAVMFTATMSFAATIPPRIKASDIMLPAGTAGQKISLLDLATIKLKDFEQLRGSKMKFADRIAFKAAQKKLRDNIDNDGTLNSKKLNKYFKKSGETGFHFGGFALGFFLGLIGILIAYLIKDDYKRNRVKWAWIGFGIYLAIFLVIIATTDFSWY